MDNESYQKIISINLCKDYFNKESIKNVRDKMT